MSLELKRERNRREKLLPRSPPLTKIDRRLVQNLKKRKRNVSGELTSLGPLQMERGFVFLGERRPLALKARANAIQVEVVAAIVERRLLAVHVAPVGARLGLLVERRSVGTEESKVLHLEANGESESSLQPITSSTRSIRRRKRSERQRSGRREKWQ